MSAYDRALFRRTLLASAVLLVLTAATVLATDEATSTAGMRVARLSAIAPLVIAMAILAVGGHARARGELRALEALGAAPWTSLRGAEYAGALLAAASLAALVTPLADATSLLPAVAPSIDWTMNADRGRATASGLVVFASGVIEAARTAAVPASHRIDASAAIPCIAPIACLISAWAASPMRVALRLSSGVTTMLLAVAALHLVAASRLPPLGAMLASLPLAASLVHARH